MRALALALPLSLFFGCRDNSASPIRIVLGPTPADDVTLVPQAALAELIDVSPSESALLVTLTSAPRTCETAPEPSADAVGLSLRFALPGATKLEPSSYPILPSGQTNDKPHVLATVKLHGRRQELLPGGDVELRQADLNPQGSLEGLLKLEFTGDAEHPATRVSGRFLAHFCRINRLR
jgi:hypothetical protein